MGPKQSTPVLGSEPKESFLISHPRFSKAKLLSDNSGEYMQISLPIANEAQVKQWQNGFKTLISNDCLMLPLSYQFKGTDMCGSNGVCKINYDNYPYILRDQILDRVDSISKPFENQELWYICYVLLEAAAIFHSAGRKVGDVQPGNIFINDNGQAKIGNQLSWPHQTTNYEKSVFQKEITFLAPEQMKDLHFGHIEPKGNYEIAQSFSIGLTLLDSAVLTNSKDIYNLSNFRINYQLLDQRLAALQSAQQLDNNLKQIIAGLCRLQPSERFKCCDLFNWLTLYKENILNITPFQIKQYPPFFRKTSMQSTHQFRRSAPQPYYVQSQVVSEIPPQRTFYEPQRIVSIYQNPVPSQLIEMDRPPMPSIVMKQGTYAFKQGGYNPTMAVTAITQPVSKIQGIPQQIQKKYQMAQMGAAYEMRKENGSTGKIESNDDFRLTLQKIDEQLALSRKMFPS